jgi:hypothetical protein|tara:strand:- start:617 stop:817 length:201 start_codon:yes stop_codon:yes gene_type:complete
MTEKEKEYFIALTQTVKLIQECIFKVDERLKKLEEVLPDNFFNKPERKQEEELMNIVAQKVEKQNA